MRTPAYIVIVMLGINRIRRMRNRYLTIEEEVGRATQSTMSRGLGSRLVRPR